jgi:hypothetical protein
MHDWTLISLTVDWETGEATIELRSPAGKRRLLAQALREISVPRAQPWGRSASINAVDGPTVQKEGLSRLAIEMQSGDLIEIVAQSFDIPNNVRNPG